MTEIERCDEIREFVLDNYPPVSTWQPEEVDNWAAWAADQGCLFLCYDKPGDNGKLVGLSIARPLSIELVAEKGISGITKTDIDKDGEIVYVDLTISTAGKPVMQSMMIAIWEKMDSKLLIAFNRLKTKDKFKVHRLGDFAIKMLTGKRYG